VSHLTHVSADRRLSGIRHQCHCWVYPNPAEDLDDDDPEDEPIVIEGEPLSETIIRERR
jgi:hypothetical protein